MIHAFNLAVLAAFWAVFAVGFIIHSTRDTALVLAGAAASFTAYFFLRKREVFVDACLILAQTFILYCVACESLFLLENTFKFNVSRRLELDSRLQKKAARKLTEERHDFFENYGDDPLFYRRTPGSKHRYRYDDDPTREMLVQTVDETGYLNADIGAYDKSPAIDAFVSGDSVLQGTGIPSALEGVRRSVPFSLWNLSAGSYSPRQKAKALELFALPKKPKLLAVEFYAGNDASEINEDAVLGASGTFEDRFAFANLYYLFLQSKAFDGMLVSPGAPGLWKLRTSDLTLALSYYIIRHLKHAAGRLLHLSSSSAVHGSATKGSKDDPAGSRPIALPAYSHYTVKPERYLDWISTGIGATLKEYDSLLAAAAKAKTPPKIAILYNPTSYEIYRGSLVDPDPAQDERARVQREALRTYAAEKGLLFLDLLPGLRKAVSGSPPLWLYGKTDPVHWSPEGTKAAAKVLAAALKEAYAAAAAAPDR